MTQNNEQWEQHALTLLEEYGKAFHTYVCDGRTIGRIPESADSVIWVPQSSLRDQAAMVEEAARRQLPIVLVCSNAMEGALALAADAEPGDQALGGYVTDGLDQWMADHGFMLEKCDVTLPVREECAVKSENAVPREMDRISDMDILDQMTVYDRDGDSRVRRAMKSMLMTAPFTAAPQLIRLYIPVMYSYKRPFLSVIIRTMGTRMDMLREAFLCLNAQKDPDMEVLVMAHKVDAEKKSGLDALIREQGKALREKIRLYVVPDGGRAHPINEGLCRARGAYFSVYDDDDLLFDSWVESFREGAAAAPGRVLHQYAVGQEWTIHMCNGQMYPMSVSGYSPLFCADFDMLSQASYNRCPLMSLAFPTRVYQQLGQQFDETLDVCEDWEYLMRLSNFLGVKDIRRVGAIYRIWQTQDNSHAANSEMKWRATEKRIMESLSERPVLMPPQWLSGYRDMDQVYKRMVKKDAYLLDTVLYLDQGSGFDEMQALHEKESIFMEEVSLTFLLPEGKTWALRWDPVVRGSILLERLEIKAFDAEEKEVKLEKTYCNGREVQIPARHSLEQERTGLFFDTEDPQMIYRVLGNTEIRKVLINCRLQERFSSEEFALYRGTGLEAVRQKLSHRSAETMHRIRRKLHRDY